MSAIASPAAGWRTVQRPPSLFCRYQFESYRDTREFLERLAELSAQTGMYPDLGFGTTYVNVTVHCGAGAPTRAELEFADRAAELARAAAATV
jgi:pterin-4a-carbinolamine dehydratase